MQSVSIAQLSSIFTFYGFSEAWPLRVGRAFLPVGIPVRSLPETPAQPGRACRRSAAERCGTLERLVSEANSLSLPSCPHPRSFAPGDPGETRSSAPASGAERSTDTRAKRTHSTGMVAGSSYRPASRHGLSSILGNSDSPHGCRFVSCAKFRHPSIEIGKPN